MTVRKKKQAAKAEQKKSSLECTILTFEVDPPEADRISGGIQNAWGRDVVELQRPGHSAVWLEVYFDSDIEALLAGRALHGTEGVRAVSVRPLRNQDWRSFWKSHFRIADVGRHLTVCPDWERRAPIGPDRRRVIIRPGIGFGTGEHFSTHFCLETIDHLCGGEHPPRSMLDLGTGSGILAIAAARLGVERVMGVDNDIQALEDAAANLRLNRLSRRVKLKQVALKEKPLSEPFELVCANVFTSVLIDLAPMLMRITGRYLVLAGIREHETDRVAEAYLALGARETVRDGNGAWSGLLFVK